MKTEQQVREVAKLLADVMADMVKVGEGKGAAIDAVVCSRAALDWVLDEGPAIGDFDSLIRQLRQTLGEP